MTVSLDTSFSSVLDSLEAAVTERGHGWRTPSVATIDSDGRPTQRMVVMRQFERSPVRLTCVTDRRSAKVAEIDAKSDVSLLYWDAASERQLRMQATAALIDDKQQTEQAWARVPESIRWLFASPSIPGEVIPHPERSETHMADTDTQSIDAIHDNFVILKFTATRLELLELASTPHRRSVFELTANGYRAAWLTP